MRSENLASLLAIAWPQGVTPVNIMSGFRKCRIHPLNLGVMHDRQTATSEAVCGGMVQPDSKEPNSPGVSSSNSAGSARSGLTTLTPPTSECGQSSGSDSRDLGDIPRPKKSSSSRRGVNTDTISITDTEFVEKMKLKELETQKKQEEAERKKIEKEQKRPEREQNRVEKEQKKAEKEALKGRKKKGKRKGKEKGRELSLWRKVNRATASALFVESTSETMKKMCGG